MTADFGNNKTDKKQKTKDEMNPALVKYSIIKPHCM